MIRSRTRWLTVASWAYLVLMFFVAMGCLLYASQ